MCTLGAAEFNPMVYDGKLFFYVLCIVISDVIGC